MIVNIQAEFDRQQAVARKAYIQFVTAGKLLRHPRLAASETSKAEAIHLKAFGVLTESLTQMQKIYDILSPTDGLESAPRRFPRYSCDMRRRGAPA